MKFAQFSGDPTVPANRLLDPEDLNLVLVYWQQQKPVVPAELNLSQMLAHEQRRRLALTATRPGFFTRDALTASGLNLTVPEAYVQVAGEILRLSATLAGSSPAVAVAGLANTWDVIFLEMWYQEVAPASAGGAQLTALAPHGSADNTSENLNSPTTYPTYSIKDPGVPAPPETTRRVQLRWRIRAHSSTTAPTGDGLVESGGYTTGPRARGDAATATSRAFSAAAPASLLPGLYVAGDGSSGHAAEFGDVAGRVWAIPIAVVANGGSNTVNINVGTQVTEKRRSASPLSSFGVAAPNAFINGDDVIFYKADGTTEIGRMIGSAGSSVNYRLRAAQIESNVATGTAPLVVASTTRVDNLNAALLDGKAVGTGTGQIPSNNGTLNANLNAGRLNGYQANANQPGTLAIIDATGGNAGKLPAAILPSAVTATSAEFLKHPSTLVNHPATDFWFRSETVNNAINAQQATSAGYATSAGSAATAAAFTGQQNSATIAATVPATPDRIVLRDGTGRVNATEVIAPTLTGTASNAALIDSTPLSFPAQEFLLVLPADEYTPRNGIAGSYQVPQITSNVAYHHTEHAKFPLKPTDFKRAGSFSGVRIQFYGSIFNLGGAGAETLGIQILNPAGTAKYAYSQSVALNGSFSLSTVGALITLTNAEINSGLEDGLWQIRVTSSTGRVNGWNCTNIYARVYPY